MTRPHPLRNVRFRNIRKLGLFEVWLKAGLVRVWFDSGHPQCVVHEKMAADPDCFVWLKTATVLDDRIEAALTIHRQQGAPLESHVVIPFDAIHAMASTALSEVHQWGDDAERAELRAKNRSAKGALPS